MAIPAFIALADPRLFVWKKNLSSKYYPSHAPFESQFTGMLDFGKGRKYFVFSKDDMYNPFDVQFVMEKPFLESARSLVIGEADWEGTFSSYPNAIYDEELKKYFMYYRCFTREVDYANEDEDSLKRKQTTCVATSNDGITFSRPSLHIYPTKNGDPTNIIHHGPTAHNFVVFHGDLQRTGKRFIAIGGVDGVIPADSGIYLFGSDDGFHFDPLKDSPILTKKHNRDEYHSYFDSMNTVSWDTNREVYWVWLRMNSGVTGYHRRQTQYLQFEDIVNGNPSPLADVMMINATFNHYVSCVSLVASEKSASYFVAIPISFPLYESVLALSRDGITFVNPKEDISAYITDPFVDSRGPPTYENYSYRQGCIPGVLPSTDGNRWLFYHLINYHHYTTPRVNGETAGVIQSFSVPKWGFTSVHAEDGYFFTSPMEIDSDSVLANVGFSFAARRLTGHSKYSSSISFELYPCVYPNTTSNAPENRGLDASEVKSFRTQVEPIWSSGEFSVQGEINVVQELHLKEQSNRILSGVLQHEVARTRACLVWKVSLHHIAFHGFWIYE